LVLTGRKTLTAKTGRREDANQKQKMPTARSVRSQPRHKEFICEICERA